MGKVEELAETPSTRLKLISPRCTPMKRIHCFVRPLKHEKPIIPGYRKMHFAFYQLLEFRTIRGTYKVLMDFDVTPLRLF